MPWYRPPLPDSPCHFLEPEDSSGVTTVFHYLYGLGHRETAFIGGNAGVRITETRLATYRKRISLHRLAADPSLSVLTDYYADDVSVASCDHFTTGAHSIPRITGVLRYTGLLGRLLIDTLLQNIKGENCKARNA